MEGSLSRGEFLKGMAVAGVATAAGPTGLVAQALGQDATGAPRLRPWELTFSIKQQYRPFALLAENFVELRDDFDGPAPRYDVLGRPGEISRAGGALRASGAPLFRSDTSQRAPFAAVIVDVESFATTAAEDTVLAGLIADEGNRVVAFYDHATKQAGIEAASGGQSEVLGTVTAELAAPCRFAFVVNENKVTALADTGEGFRPLIQRNVREVVDLRRPAVLASHKNGFGVRSEGTIVLGRVQAGYYGQAGVRDPHVVTYADGTPYIRHGKLYLTLTQAGLSFFETAHWGVWTLDLSDYTKLEQVGNLFFMREGMDAVLGDHAGHIVVDPSNHRFVLAMSTWGDFTFDGVEVNYAVVEDSPLHGVHVFQTRELELPTSSPGRWDPHLLRHRGRWYVAFVDSPHQFDQFYPALATSRHGLSDFTLVGADASKHATEGTVLQRVGGQWYLLASSADTREYLVYDLGVQQVGTLDAPYPTNIPWPMLVPVPLPRGRTKYLLITFNGTQYFEPVLGYGTHGDFFVMEAEQIVKGYEFPPRH